MKTPLALSASTALALSLLTAGPAVAWGDEGHKVVALIAWGMMTPRAKGAVNIIMAHDTDKLTAADFASKATWADKFRDTSRGSTTAPWHYVNLEIAKPDLKAACFDFPKVGGPASSGPSNDCVVHKIEQFEQELRNPGTTADEKVLALKYLLHFVGDVHQPLHASDDHDHGGNCEWVSFDGGGFFGMGRGSTKLHTYWDTNVVKKLGQDPKAVATLLTSQITAGELAQWQRGTARDWAIDSYNVARRTAYNLGPRPACGHANESNASKLTPEYETAAKQAAALQLEKAGVRLATILNRAL